MDGVSTLTFTPAATLAGAGAMAGTSTLTFSPAAVLAGAGALSATDLLAGLSCHYRLDEASGERKDSHSTKHLTDVNTTGQAAGKIGNAADFTPATNNYLKHADDAAHEITQPGWSSAFWVFLDAKSAVYVIVSKADFTDDNWYVLYDNAADKFKFFARIGGGVFVLHSLTPVSTGTWYFIVCRHDDVGDIIDMSINNGTPESAAAAGGLSVNTNEFRVGRLGNVSPADTVDGRVDSLSIWQRLLTNAEVSALYNSGTGLDYPFNVALRFLPTSTLLGDGALAGATSLSFALTGAMTGAGALAGASALTFTLTGDLTASGSGDMAGATSLSFAVTGTMAGAGALSGASALTFTAAGTMAGAGALAGASSLTFSLTGVLADSGAGLTWTTVGYPFLYTAANWTGAGFYFEAYFKATAGTVSARLLNETASAEVTGSKLDTASASLVRMRSGNLKDQLVDGASYRSQFGHAGGAAGVYHHAQLIAF